MALTVNSPLLRQQVVYCHSQSIGTTPVAAAIKVPFRGTVVEVGCTPSGTVTSTTSISYAISGTVMGGSPMSLVSTGAGIGVSVSAVPTNANAVTTDDYITFTPGSGAGAAVPAMFYAVIRAG
jgi:hypothetical protein